MDLEVTASSANRAPHSNSYRNNQSLRIHRRLEYRRDPKIFPLDNCQDISR